MYCFIAGGAALQGAICGLAGMFPHAYMQSVFSGMLSLCDFVELKILFEMIYEDYVYQSPGIL